MIISLIVAVSENNVIGKDNALPWHLPTDVKYFRDVTMGHCVIMGRKNYDSIPLKYRPLDGRTNIVVTRQKDFKAQGCIVVNSMEEALKEAKKVEIQQLPLGRGTTEVFIIGGADIYRQTIDVADKIHYTKIHHEFDGDAFFPVVDLNKWKLTSRKEVAADEKNKFPFSFCVYEKK
jgi:dihydrofolate reductase